VLQPASIVERVHQGLNHLKASFQNPTQTFKGQSLVETSLVMGLVGVVCIGTVATLGGNISTLMADASSAGSPSTALVVNNQLVNSNLGAPTNTTNGGFISGVNNTPAGTVELENETPEPVSPGGTESSGISLPSNTIDNTTAGGPIGPSIRTNPAGTGAGTAITPRASTQKPQQQTFSPEYQAWRNNPNNAKTVAMIDSLSPDGQKIANTYYNSMALGDGRDPLQVLLSDGSLKQSDWTIVNNFRNSAFALVTE
jgi:Flp pilus assembly pilin Flp